MARFVSVEGMELLAEYVGVETGKGANALDRRPVLREALAHAGKAKGIAVVVSEGSMRIIGPACL
jgi:hypothetical protein